MNKLYYGGLVFVLLLIAILGFSSHYALAQITPALTPGVYIPAVSRGVDDVTPISTPTPTSAVEILSSNVYTEDGSYIVYAEVMNVSDETLCNIRLGSKFYLSIDNWWFPTYSNAEFHWLEPGQRSPVIIEPYLLNLPPDEITGYSIEWAKPTGCIEPRTQYVLTVVNAGVRSSQSSSETVELYGEIRNDTGMNISYYEVRFTFYKPDGSILGVMGDAWNDLPAGQTKSFVFSRERDWVNIPFVAQAEGQVEEP